MSTVHCDCLRARSLLHHDIMRGDDDCTRNIVFTIIILQFIRNIFLRFAFIYLYLNRFKKKNERRADLRNLTTWLYIKHKF